MNSESKKESSPVIGETIKAITNAQVSWRQQQYDEMDFSDKHSAYISGFADGVESKPKSVIGERSAEEILIKHIPHGCINLVDYKTEKYKIISAMEEYRALSSDHEKWIKLIDAAFVAGRGKTSWEQFKKDHGIYDDPSGPCAMGPGH